MNMGALGDKKLFVRLGVLLFFGSGLLTACTSTNSADATVNWLFLVLAIVAILILAIGLFFLIKSGKFKQWGTAGIKSNQWKSQERKLTSQKEKLEGEKQNLITELGRKAWEARVSDPSYAAPFDELVALDQQKTQLVDEVKSLEAELIKVRYSRSKLANEYAKQISDLESQHKDVTKKIEKANAEQAKFQKELEKISKDQEKSQVEIEKHLEKLAEVQASDAPDKDAQVTSIGEAVTALQGSLAVAQTRIAGIETDISHLELEQQPFSDKLTRLTGQLSTVEDDQKGALEPLDQRIAALEEKIQVKKETIEALTENMTPIIEGLGPLVEAARPEAEALTPTYKKIDETNANLGELSQELHLILARLETCDQGAVRNFYLMVAGILILVVLSVVFFILAWA